LINSILNGFDFFTQQVRSQEDQEKIDQSQWNTDPQYPFDPWFLPEIPTEDCSNQKIVTASCITKKPLHCRGLSIDDFY